MQELYGLWAARILYVQMQRQIENLTVSHYTHIKRSHASRHWIDIENLNLAAALPGNTAFEIIFRPAYVQASARFAGN